MSSIKKTIQINPELFSMSSNKTRKNREKKPLVNNKPFISPNILKNKLLNRIKEHKRKETENLERHKNHASSYELNSNQSIRNDGIRNNGIRNDSLYSVDKYTDEFNDSIEYLQNLSKKKKFDNEKELYEKKLLRQKQELENRTVKNYHSLNGHSLNNPFVNIDLPEDLREPLISVNTEQLSVANTNAVQLRPAKDEIPYGVLKGGAKPTYREWNKTMKNHEVSDPNAALILNKNTSEREKRLNILKEKIKQKQALLIHGPTSSISTVTPSSASLTTLSSTLPVAPLVPAIQVTTPLSNQGTMEEIVETQNLIQLPKVELTKVELPNAELSKVENNNMFVQSMEPTKMLDQVPTKKIIKKTIKRKYTLGKSRIKKSVAVLLKDRNTRKIILSAQKDLKKKPINDVKQYLREHNLIKVGTNAPNDVIRKIYESAMLTGEITNNNKDTLLHNFLKEDINV